MDNKYQLVSTATAVINHPPSTQNTHLQLPIQQPQQETLSQQNNVDDFSQLSSQSTPPSPKITVSLPKHAASKLRDLVQRRDIALLRLGIISVQFDNDQIIPLTLNTTTTNLIHQTQANKSQSMTPTEPSIVGPSLESCNTSCIENLNTTITALTSLPSPNDPIIEEDEDIESNVNNSDSQILNSSIAVTTTTTTTMSRAPSMVRTTKQTDCNTSNLAVVYDDDDDDDKDEDEVVNEVENQHSSYNIQLSQLEFADPIELEMYDNDNLLFPDYTLNLS